MKKIVLIVVVCFVVLYIGSYCVLSTQGQYVPAAWGLGWVKWYLWAPRGFVSGREGVNGNRLPQTFYLPLWLLDRKFIHPRDEALNGKYPVNTVLDNALQEKLKLLESVQETQAVGEADAPLPLR